MVNPPPQPQVTVATQGRQEQTVRERRQFINPVRRAPPTPRSGPSSGDEVVIIPGAEVPVTAPHYPEHIFLSKSLPTRSSGELRHFKEHCSYLWHQANRAPIELTHELLRIQDITTSPLQFQHYLWKYKVRVDGEGIVETYALIKKRVWNNAPDRAYLEPAYTVSYPWHRTQWTTTDISQLL